MDRMRPFNRRDFVRGIGAGALVAPAAVRTAAAATDPDAVFTHGVASGDPLASQVIIWTRVNPALGERVPVNWEVALDEAFTTVIRRGLARAVPGSDHTVKVDVLRLPAGRRLFYRFHAAGKTSMVGRTRTLPAADATPSMVRFVVFSCSNYPAGYFNAYAEAARLTNVHAAIHLGDYIYEYAKDGYASDDAVALGRVSDPETELYTLADYRRRYAQYRSDADLQACHAAMPFICVWDDHEVANDAWTDGAQNHTPATEGPWAARLADALKAYHEWMPIRTADPTKLDTIYRSFTWGNLVNLHMLDTRIIGRQEQLDYANYIGPGGFDAARFTADISNPARQLLGVAQTQWLQQQMATSSATWTVLGQQVLMGRMNIPAPLVLGQISFSAYTALLRKAVTNPGDLTPQERAILAAPAIPYNLDAWDGYAVARETVLGTARAFDKNLVVLAGDTHNAWASNLDTFAGQPAGVEFATASVSSPGLETFFPTEDPVAVAAGLEQIIGPLVYAETANRGFLEITATPAECKAEWHYVSTVKRQAYRRRVGKVLKTLPGPGGRRVVAG